jgi:hypothetical protein
MKNMWENSLKGINMEKELINIKMVMNLKDIMKKIKSKEQVKFITKMVLIFTDFGAKIW